MDLGIRGKHALVCGSSKGLGRGCAQALTAEGVHVTLVARHADVLARTTIIHNVTINNLLPGPFDTGRLNTTMALSAKTAGISLEQAIQARKQKNPAGRFGDPAEFGAVCAFLCSVHAGYMTGQNVLLDGGAYPGTL